MSDILRIFAVETMRIGSYCEVWRFNLVLESSMKILHVVNISFVIPYFLGKQLNYFASKGYEEHIICSPSDELESFSEEFSFEYKEVPVLRKISVSTDVKAVLAAARYIRKKKIDVVVGHTPKGGLIAMLAAYICRVPRRIYFRHGLVYETSKGIKRTLLLNIDRLAALLSTKVVCVSKSVGQRSVEDGLNKPKKQIVLAQGTCNGIDTERFAKSNINNDGVDQHRSRLGIDKGDFVIGFAGRMVKDKGIIELVQAFELLQAKYTQVKLLLIGQLEERDALPQDIVESIKNNPGIITTGYVLNSTIECYYSLMNLFVLPSYREGFPTSVLEASSMGIPVVTTKATGCIDAIIEDETGLFVGHTGKELYEAMNRLIENEQLCSSMGEKGRSFVVNNYRQEIVWNEIEKLYTT